MEQIKGIREYALRYGVATSHPQHVASLANSLFEFLRPLHRLGKSERLLLTAAAVLHDIGWAEGGPKHHKRAYDYIIADPPPGLSKRETAIVANTARYHRKGLPKISHQNYSMLAPEDAEIVRKLAAILRIADGLDVTHTNAVEIAECDIGDIRVVVRIKPSLDILAEVESAAAKSDLFEEVFHKTVDFAQLQNA